MAQRPPIKIKRSQLVFSSWGTGWWLPAAIMDLKLTCLMWDVTHTYKKNRTSVQFHRIRETSWFPTNIEQCLGSFLRIKETTEHVLDLNHTICNQKHHIFCSSSFLEILKAVYFSKPSILTARSYISSAEYQFLSTVCSQEPFKMFSLGDEQFRTTFFWGVTFSHLFVWDRKETLNEIPLRRVLEKSGGKK